MARWARVMVPGVAHHATQRENRPRQAGRASASAPSGLSVVPILPPPSATAPRRVTVARRSHGTWMRTRSLLLRTKKRKSLYTEDSQDDGPVRLVSVLRRSRKGVTRWPEARQKDRGQETMSDGSGSCSPTVRQQQLPLSLAVLPPPSRRRHREWAYENPAAT